MWAGFTPWTLWAIRSLAATNPVIRNQTQHDNDLLLDLSFRPTAGSRRGGPNAEN